MQPVGDDVERRAIAKFLEAVIRDADYTAEITAAFLKAHGFRPSRKDAGSSGGVPPDSSAIARAKAVLLNLGAALRIALWERAGFRAGLPADLPSSSEAFRNVVPPAVPERTEDARPVVPELHQKVFWTWLQQFSGSSRAALGTDVLLPVKTDSEEKLLDALAELPWENRQLATTRSIHDDG